jgi:hypothetical protein
MFIPEPIRAFSGDDKSLGSESLLIQEQNA